MLYESYIQCKINKRRSLNADNTMLSNLMIVNIIYNYMVQIFNNQFKQSSQLL